MAINAQTYQFLVGVFASLGSLLFGYDLGVIGGVVAAKSFLATFQNPAANEVGAVVSVFTGGAFFGAFIAGSTGDWLGRRLTILIGAIVFCLGGGLQTGAASLAYLYSGRAIAGLGVGILVMIVPLYQAEIAHPAIRGRITALQQFMLGIGAVIAVWAVYGTNLHYGNTDNSQWRIPLGLQIVPAGILALLILLFPESPRWLIDHGQNQKGLETLAQLHANGDIQDPWVAAEYAQIQETITHEHDVQISRYQELFTDRSAFRRLLLAIALQASVQMTGVSAIQYFTPEIYGKLNIETTDALKYQGVSNVLSVLAQLCTILLIDRIGRRWPLIIGNLVNCFCFAVVTAVQASFDAASPSTQYGLGWTFIVINWVYQVSFSFTCGPLSWIIPAEIFDTRTRSLGVSMGTMSSFAFNTMIGQVTNPAIENIGWRYFLVFVVCNFTNAVFFWMLLPETAKRPLEEMDLLFSSKSWFVPTMKMADFSAHDLENRVNEKLQGEDTVHLDTLGEHPATRP